jgi:hypothetical protein
VSDDLVTVDIVAADDDDVDAGDAAAAAEAVNEFLDEVVGGAAG